MGGNNLSIQFLPKILISKANKIYIKPAATIPVTNPSTPPLLKATAIGVIYAKELPK